MKRIQVLLQLLASILVLGSCQVQHQAWRARTFEYERFRASLTPTPLLARDTANAIEDYESAAGPDSVLFFLRTIDSVWKREKAGLISTRTSDKTQKKMIKSGLAAVNKNIRTVDVYLNGRADKKNADCAEKDCPLVAEVVKSKQLMYLYVSGNLQDSFAVSTGIPGRETPNMNLRPTGPLFTRYTSTKYPEGNYMGLGNMPYAVFIKGGYAIHGTTQGNLAKLGKKASHGCIRLHPDHAKLFYELVKMIGLNNTWVIVR